MLFRFCKNYNNNRYREAMGNLTPKDVYYGRSDKTVEKRAILKQETLTKKRPLYDQQKVINL